MGILLRSVKKRKKSRRLGEVEIVSREEYAELELDAKVEMIRSLVPLGLMRVHELLDDEVKALAGKRYARKHAPERGRRHGSNPGTVGLARPAGTGPCATGSERRGRRDSASLVRGAEPRRRGK